MKRKLFAALVVIGAMSLTACQEDTTMDELLQDTTLNSVDGTGTGNGSGGSGDGGNGSGTGGSGG